LALYQGIHYHWLLLIRAASCSPVQVTCLAGIVYVTWQVDRAISVLPKYPQQLYTTDTLHHLLLPLFLQNRMEEFSSRFISCA